MPKCNSKGIDLIKLSEGLRLSAYLCPAGVWTIGYGTTKGVKPGMKITVQEAEELLLNDMRVFENGVTALTKTVKLTSNQFSALVSFAYNLGLTALKDSTLMKRILANTYDPDIDRQFKKWVYAGGRILPGLVNRRAAESKLYFSPDEPKKKAK
ncbi:lysozyme [Pontibacter qinzhouensis]|uniref:Lysozyme n=1 Tax=Pontibacter qinzhouensis TaxID=2603253 RepID=A0A5C8IZP9_9BACT|nr:lysozyme [Pontibacter qinzhouensis]TXK26534.1 lysozyme [Pontibacter qinzhouensis]